MITLQQLQDISGAPTDRCSKFFQPLADAMTEFAITTELRQAAFLAQVLHESGALRYVAEIASGAAYEGRADLGNTDPGDGQKFKGRGLIQITGRANYVECGKALGLKLVLTPSLLETPAGACRSAAWFWQTRNLNELADGGKFGAITKRINGGFNGIDERLEYYLVARKAVGL